MIVNYEEYTEAKRSFFEKHNYDFETSTSIMDQYGNYNKVYSFQDGAQWFEDMGPEYVKQEIEVKRAKVTVEVKMFRTEFWNTEAGSKYYYEKF